MAAIRKRNGKFQVQIRRKGFRYICKSFHLRRDAVEWARIMETKADRNELGPSLKSLDEITLGELVTRYRDEVLPRKKAGDREEIMLNAFLRFPINKKRLADVSTADFAKYRDKRLETIKPRSLKRELSPLQNMFEIARREWELPIAANPLADLKLKATDNRRERRLRNGEWEKLQEASSACRNPFMAILIEFALETAMRRGEMISLKWRNVDNERNSLRISETKNGYSRTIPLTRRAERLLHNCRQLGEGVEPKKRVFQLSANAVRLSWVRICLRAGIEDLHFHDLRHEAISRLFDIGLTLPEVSSISGHRDVRMLLRYAHADNATLRDKLS